MNAYQEQLLGLPGRITFSGGSGSIPVLADERCHVAWAGAGVEDSDRTIIALGSARIVVELDPFVQLFTWQDIHTVIHWTVTYLNSGEVEHFQTFVTFSALDMEDDV